MQATPDPHRCPGGEQPAKAAQDRGSRRVEDRAGYATAVVLAGLAPRSG
jgi:hypothetical protein